MHGMLCVDTRFRKMSGLITWAGGSFFFFFFLLFNFGTDHFQLFKNRVDVRKLGQNFDEKRRRKPNHTKTGAYENQGLIVFSKLREW